MSLICYRSCKWDKSQRLCIYQLKRTIGNAVFDLRRRFQRGVNGQLAEILETYRLSMGSPSKGVMFHSGRGEHMDLYNLSRQVIRPAMKAIRLEWYGWHACRRGIASNLFELGANEKVVQRILRHAKPHVTKERYIKAFDPAVLAAMKTLETTLDDFHKCSATVQQVN